MDERYRPALEHRLRHQVEPIGAVPFDVWVARPEDIIVGKLMAWQEGRPTRQSDDIYEMLLFDYLEHPAVDSFDYDYVAQRAAEIGNDATALWIFLNNSARETAEQIVD